MIHVDWRASCSLSGTVLKWLSVPLLFPLLLGIYYGGDVLTFLLTIGVTLVAGVALERLDADPHLGPREAFLMVALAWLLVSVVGALPYVIAGNDTVAQPVNALFESMSGFTTTGATVMGDISFETHSHAILMWRQMTQWLGGMGIIVLAVAILSKLAVGGTQLMEAEAPGPGIEKLTPTIAQTARILWELYFAITLGFIVLLYSLHLVGLAPNMDLYNAIAHGFTTLPTGGFSPEARSIEAFSPAVQWVISPFMLVAGTNFALMWHVTKDRDLRTLLDNAEFRFYAVLIAFFTLTLTAFLTIQGEYATIEESLRHGLFQTAAITTTTGYASTDFDLWSGQAKILLFAMMFLGGSTASTGGGIKMLRWLVVYKSIRNELFRTIHPEAVRPVRVGDQVIDERTVQGIYLFMLLYFTIFLVATVVISADAARSGVDLSALEALSGVTATLGNIGPAFDRLGPMGSYIELPATTRLLMVVLMWIGRLELLTVLVIFTPSFWRS
jgi:trk system potassium uptake protein